MYISAWGGEFCQVSIFSKLVCQTVGSQFFLFLSKLDRCQVSLPNCWRCSKSACSLIWTIHNEWTPHVILSHSQPHMSFPTHPNLIHTHACLPCLRPLPPSAMAPLRSACPCRPSPPPPAHCPPSPSRTCWCNEGSGDHAHCEGGLGRTRLAPSSSTCGWVAGGVPPLKLFFYFLILSLFSASPKTSVLVGD
jgi:hypothetical protein